MYIKPGGTSSNLGLKIIPAGPKFGFEPAEQIIQKTPEIVRICSGPRSILCLSDHSASTSAVSLQIQNSRLCAHHHRSITSCASDSEPRRNALIPKRKKTYPTNTVVCACGVVCVCEECHAPLDATKKSKKKTNSKKTKIGSEHPRF